MNKELKELIERQKILVDKSERRHNQLEIGKKVNEIINNNVDLESICDETGFSKKHAADLVMTWVITCTKI